MPRIFKCPRCNRKHSISEYEENRFCRNCESLLLDSIYEEEVVEGWRRLFPYDPYPPQIDFMNDIERIIGEGRVLIAEACNGFGKTVSSLSALLAMGRSMVYATRTHEQVRQVLQELQTINEKSGSRYSAVNLASRQFLCLNPECQDLPLRDAQEMCSLLREKGECRWVSDIEEPPRSIPPVLTQSILKSIGRRYSICPYYLARKISKRCDIVVVPYPYIFNSKVKMSVGLELTDRTLIMDEGHNLDKVGQENLSDTLTEYVIDLAREELKAVNGSTRHMEMLARYLRQNTSRKPLLKSAYQLHRELELVLGSDLFSIIDQYLVLVNRIKAFKNQKGDPHTSYLNGIMTFLELVAQSTKTKYVALYSRNQRGNSILDYRCLDASLAIKPVIEEANSTIIMSGTITPVNLFAEIVGLSNSEKKVYSSIQNPKNIRMIVNESVTTAFRERTNEMILRIGRIIASEIASIANGVLIFFPQRRFMDTCLDVWGLNKIIEARQGRLYLGDKPLYMEGRRSNSNRELVSRYKHSAVHSQGAVLCCVFRGRNSEGSNFPDEQARGIFLIGVPYANYGDPIVRAQINYYNRRKPGLGQKWYTMDAFRASNQALGRGIRNKDDWCHFWLMDKRYTNNIKLISKWAQGNGPEYVS